MLDDKVRSHDLEREQEQIDRIVRESGGKLTRRLVNSQVTSCPPHPTPDRVYTSHVLSVHICLRPQHRTWIREGLTLFYWVFNVF